MCNAIELAEGDRHGSGRVLLADVEQELPLLVGELLTAPSVATRCWLQGFQRGSGAARSTSYFGFYVALSNPCPAPIALIYLGSQRRASATPDCGSPNRRRLSRSPDGRAIGERPTVIASLAHQADHGYRGGTPYDRTWRRYYSLVLASAC